jgi:hypothetical protein
MGMRLYNKERTCTWGCFLFMHEIHLLFIEMQFSHGERNVIFCGGKIQGEACTDRTPFALFLLMAMTLN